MGITMEEQVARALDGRPLEAPAPEVAVRVVDMRIQSEAREAARRELEVRVAARVLDLALEAEQAVTLQRQQAAAAREARRRHLATRWALRGTQRALTVARRRFERSSLLALSAIGQLAAVRSELVAAERLRDHLNEDLANVRAELETLRMRQTAEG